MSKQSFKSQAINAVLTAIIRTLLGWAEEWGNDAFFFLVIGDKTCTDVAWFNTDQLACDSAIAVADDPQAAGAFQNLSTSVDILLEDRLKNEKFKSVFQETSSSSDDNGWYSIENDGK